MSVILNGSTGITTPGLINTGSETVVNLTTSGNTILGDASTDTLNVGNNGIVKDASGNVMIGNATAITSSAGRGYLLVNGSSNALIDFGVSGASVGYIYHTGTDLRLFNAQAGALQLYTSGTERMRIDSAGNVGIGATTTNGKLTIKNPSAGSEQTLFNIQAESSTTNIGSITYNQTTDTMRLLNNSNYSGATLEFGVNATTNMTLNKSGNLGLGVTPSAWNTGFKALQVTSGASLWGDATTTFVAQNYYYGSTGYVYIASNYASDYYQQSGSHVWRTAASGTAGATVTLNTAMTLTAGGLLLVGTTDSSPNYKTIISFNGGGNNGFTLLNTGSAGNPTIFSISDTAQSLNNTSWCAQYNDSTTQRWVLRKNGGLANYQANNANLSDERVKKDIVDAGSYLDKICAIPVRTFLYKDQTDDLLNLGVIAQEVEAVAPELVDVSGFGETPEDGVPLKAIYQTDLQYALMKCIQELKAELDITKAKVAALEAA